MPRRASSPSEAAASGASSWASRPSPHGFLPFVRLLDVRLTGDRVGSVGAAPQDDERAHPYVEPCQTADDAAVRDQHEHRAVPVRRDGPPDLGELALAALGVVERALQRFPRLSAPERQPPSVQTPAARAGHYHTDLDAAPAKRLADPCRMRT